MILRELGIYKLGQNQRNFLGSECVLFKWLSIKILRHIFIMCLLFKKLSNRYFSKNLFMNWENIKSNRYYYWIAVILQNWQERKILGRVIILNNCTSYYQSLNETFEFRIVQIIVFWW